jgi:hypothetical protein
MVSEQGKPNVTKVRGRGGVVRNESQTWKG